MRTASATVPEELPSLVARARHAQGLWSEQTLDQRIALLAPIKDQILARAETIAALIHREVGKPEIEALLGEVLPTADVFAYWFDVLGELLEPAEIELDAITYPGKHGTVTRVPRGVIGVIMPWNFPFALPLRTLVPALLAGNAVVFKPSEVAPQTGALVAELFKGLPDGVFCLAQGAGDMGAALCESDVDLIVFTGSVPAGKRVAHACAERLIPCSLELGGKDAALVLADAPLERAVHGVVWGALMNAGQNCAAIERVYVEKKIADEFLRRVRDEVRSLRMGPDLGPLATQAQRAHVTRQVDQAKAAGAELLEGGTATEPGYGYLPTVLRVGRDDFEVMNDETFGPVLAVAVVENADEAVRRANASRYGLTASIWTRNVSEGQRLASRLRVGVVTLNNHGFTGAIPAAPWSGVGETATGVTGSPLALDALTRPRFVLVDRSRSKRELWWYPYTPTLRAIALALATLRCGTASIFAKVSALCSLLVALPKRLFGKDLPSG
jgi:acyl-CoA reductase-like NAD-dependent aldehyde dehydrogenase